MPVYQYLCPKCNMEFDLRQSFDDEAIVTCPNCQNGAQRLFVPVPIIFKGSGFYVTDNAKRGEPQSSPKKENKENNAPSAQKKEDTTPAAAQSDKTTSEREISKDTSNKADSRN